MMAGGRLDIRDHVVATLPPLAPAAARTERVRALCRARLERDRRRSRWLASISMSFQNLQPAWACMAWEGSANRCSPQRSPTID